MDRLLVLLFLPPMFSTCWKLQVNATAKSLGEWMYHQDFVTYTEVKVETPSNPLLLTTLDEQLRARFPTLDVDRKIAASGNYVTGSAATLTGIVNTPQKRRKMQGNFSKSLKLQNTKIWKISRNAESLRQMLVAIVKLELSDCDLVLAYDAAFSQHPVLEGLLQLPNQRQVSV